ncbi:MAG: hypothetical protein ABII25_10250 [bacterium]
MLTSWRKNVVPAKAGNQKNNLRTLDSRFRGNDVLGLWIILAFLLSFCSIAQRNDGNNPHNLAANSENCLYCHNKSNIPAERESLTRARHTHKFKLEIDCCSQCHIMDDTRSKTPRFKKSVTDLCIKPCHSGGALGVSHPVEVVPDFKVPDFLPLENGEVTCGTCHNPHSSPIIKTKSLIGWKGGKSYFLRVDNSHGELCRTCHEASNWHKEK